YDVLRLDGNQHPDLAPLDEAEQRVLWKALAKNPEQRYPSCRLFVEALKEAQVAPPSPPPPLPPQRRPLPLLPSFILLLPTALLAWAFVQSRQGTPSGEDPSPKEAKKVLETQAPDHPGPANPARLTTLPRGYDLARQSYGILKKYCYRCHGVAFEVPGFNIL